VLEKVPGIAMSEATKASILGEAKFLRSFAYFFLVRLYGDVPLVRNAEEQLANGPRTPKAEVYAQIVKDAEEAEAALPASWPATERGRATRGAAAAHLASVYTWLSTKENSPQWDKAAAAAKRVIDSGNYRLETNWLTAFAPGSQNSPEAIFLALACGATGCPGITTSQWMYPREMESSGTGGFATQMPLPEFIATFPAGDYRAQTGAQVGLPGPNGVGYFTSGRRLNGQVVTFAPHIYKFRQTTKPGPSDVNNPLIRYADVLLTYAEAVNELGRPAEAITYVNMIRARARGGATGSENRAQPADLPVMNQADTREAIFQERRWELAHEGKRWFDMVRRGQSYFLASLAKDKYATGADANDMLWPIPQTQIDVNPVLSQNPGY
jgi:starch-binding outer membrane protein, SusD/RagB family